MRYRLLTLLIFIVLLESGAGCSVRPAGSQLSSVPTMQPTKSEDEDNAVYSALLDGVYVREGTDQVIISGETSLDWLNREQLDQDLKFVRKDLPGPDSQDVVSDFLEKNSLPPHTLGAGFQVKTRSLVLNKQEVSAIGQADGWTQFLTKYPNQSLITLSRVGFNRRMDEALVYTSSQSGGRTGRGQYVLLSKVDNAWVIKRKVAAWVS